MLCMSSLCVCVCFALFWIDETRSFCHLKTEIYYFVCLVAQYNINANVAYNDRIANYSGWWWWCDLIGDDLKATRFSWLNVDLMLACEWRKARKLKWFYFWSCCVSSFNCIFLSSVSFYVFSHFSFSEICVQMEVIEHRNE